MRSTLLPVVVALLTSPGLPAQTRAQYRACDAADEHFDAGRWAEALDSYLAVLEVDGSNEYARYRSALVLLEQGQLEEALVSFRRTEAVPAFRNDSVFAQARVLTAMGEAGKAAAAVLRAVDGGFVQLDRILDDEHLSTLRGDESFEEVVDRIRRRPLPTSEFSPSWSPDGTRLVYDALYSSTGSSDLYVVNADGTGRKRITRSRHHDRIPVWSPVEDLIVFFRVNAYGHGSDCWSVRSDGSGLTRLTGKDGLPGGGRSEVAFSRDGSRLYFQDGEQHIHELVFATGTVRRVTTTVRDRAISM